MNYKELRVELITKNILLTTRITILKYFHRRCYAITSLISQLSLFPAEIVLLVDKLFSRGYNNRIYSSYYKTFTAWTTLSTFLAVPFAIALI